MSSTTVYPNGDGSIGGWTTDTNTTSGLYSRVSEGTASPNDSNYIQTVTASDPIYLLLGDMPGDFGTATAVTIKTRGACSFVKTDWLQDYTVRLVQSDQSTAITAASSTTTVDTSPTNYSASPSITGATSKSAWDGARLKITSGTGSNGTLYIYAAQVEITYTAAASGKLFLVSFLSGLGGVGQKSFSQLERSIVSDPGIWVPRLPQILVPAFIAGA